MTERVYHELIEALESIPISSGVVWSDKTAALYARELADIHDRAIRRVIPEILRTCRWRPTIAEIRDMIGDADAPTPGWSAEEFDRAERQEHEERDRG